MKLDGEQLKLLGLSSKEIKVLDALRVGNNTPLLISKAIKVSRPAIYEILVKLHKRGLIKTNIVNGKKYWSQAKERDIEQNLFNTKKQLFNINERVEEVHGLSDSTVIIHRGGEAIRTLINGIIVNQKEQRLYSIQGDAVVIGWEKVFGTEQTNEINKFIKKNALIVETIMPFGWFERQTELLGKKWAEEFEGRSAISHEIDGDYFQHAGQVWMFKNSVYLIAMNEEIVIEIRNSEIQKLIKSMFGFIQDNSHKFDVNARLRQILAEETNN